MATDARVEKYARRGRYQAHEHSQEHRPASRPPEKKRGRLFRRLGFFLIFLAVLVWFLPSIVIHTPLLGFIIHKATGEWKGTVSIQSASVGWLSPISISGIEVRDEQNQPMLTAASVTGDKSLLAIACNYSQLGRFRVDKPLVSIVMRERGSNVEDLMDKLPPSPPESGQKPSAGVAVDLEISDGAIKITDEPAKQSWQFDKFDVRLALPADSNQPMTLKASAVLTDGRQPGKLSAEFSMKSSAADKTKNSGDATLQLENLPLSAMQTLLDRAMPKSRLAGRLNCEIHALWGGEKAEGKTIIQATAAAEEFAFAAPALGNDCVQLSHLSAGAQIVQSAEKVDIEKVGLDCDLGDITIIGGLQRNDPMKGMSADSLMRQPCRISGRLDIARLAAMLPCTLHIRPGTQITSGQVQFGLISQPPPAGANDGSKWLWHGQVETGKIMAVNANRPIEWNNPIALVLEAHDSPQGAIIDDLKCISDFLKIDARGTPDDLYASLSVNFQTLGDQLEQFVDLGGLHLAGEGTGNVDWRRDSQKQFKADAEFQLHNLQVISPKQPPWREENLSILCSANGKTDWSADTRIDIAAINVKAGEDRISMELAQPLANLRGGVPPVHAQLQGQVQNWMTRMSSFIPLGAWKTSGAIHLDAQLKPTADLVRCELSGQVNNLAVADSAGGQFLEPEVQISARGDYDPKNGTLRLEEGQIRSSFLAASVAGRVAGSAANQPPPELDSRFEYDLARVCDLARPSLGRNVHLVGRGVGSAAWRGPFSIAAGQASAELKWDQAYLYGFQVGPADVKPTLMNGVLQIAPMELAVGQGKIYFAPKVNLSSNPMEFTLPPGPLVRQVPINPDMCGCMLKYIAPIMADVATAPGTFSIELEHCRIPLGDPAKGDLAGKFIVHSMEIGPGPLVREMAILTGRETPARLRQESVVPFQMANGRISHQGMELIFPDFTVRTSGSVGIADQTLDIMAEMPVPPKWLENNPAAPALRNQTIRLPLAGTLSHPQLDRAEMEKQSAQFIRKAATGLIQEGLKNELDRLLPPR
jgi:hypothetical protein